MNEWQWFLQKLISQDRFIWSPFYVHSLSFMSSQERFIWSLFYIQSLSFLWSNRHVISRHDICQIFYPSSFSTNMKIYQKNAQTVTFFTPKDPIFGILIPKMWYSLTVLLKYVFSSYQLYQKLQKIFEITQEISLPWEILPKVKISLHKRCLWCLWQISSLVISACILLENYIFQRS